MSKLKLVISGEDVGDFLYFYFDDESLKAVGERWVCPAFGERQINYVEFRETAERFGIEIGYERVKSKGA